MLWLAEEFLALLATDSDIQPPLRFSHHHPHHPASPLQSPPHLPTLHQKERLNLLSRLSFLHQLLRQQMKGTQPRVSSVEHCGV